MMASRPTGYSLLNYGNMVSCEPRMPAFVAALKAAVTPGCKVIDLGSGPGVFAVLACKFGAASAVAIEPDETSQLVMKFAEANGYADCVSVFEGISTDYSTDEKADVIISDLHGSLPYYEKHIPTIVDARKRLLKPGGILIPASDTLRMSLVDSSKAYSSYETPWISNSLGLDLSGGHPLVSNQPLKTSLEVADLLSDPVVLGTIDYRVIEQADYTATVEMAALRPGTAHGFALWFDCELVEGIGFSNAPGQPTQVYGQTFFPFSRPLGLSEGDSVTCEVTAMLVGGEYVWGWKTSLFRFGQPAPEHVFSQSTFHAKIFSARSLSTQSSTFVPAFSRAMEIDRACLEMVDGRRSLGSIADELRSRYPSAFATEAEALDHVARLAGAYR